MGEEEFRRECLKAFMMYGGSLPKRKWAHRRDNADSATLPRRRNRPLNERVRAEAAN